MTGPDHAFAIEPEELKDMVSKIRDIEKSMGDGMKNGPREEEIEFYENARRSLFAKTDIQKGDIITDDKIIIKRPSYGIHPSLLSIVLDRTAKDDINADDPITWSLI